MKVEKRFISDDGTLFEDAFKCLAYEVGDYTDSEIEAVIERFTLPFCYYAKTSCYFYLVTLNNIEDIKKLIYFCTDPRKNADYTDIRNKIDFCLCMADSEGDFPAVSFVMSYDDDFCIIEDCDIKRMISDTLDVFEKINAAI